MVKSKMLKFIWIISLVIFFLSPAAPAASLELKIATLSPDGSPWMLKMREGAKEISRKTDNRVRFKF